MYNGYAYVSPSMHLYFPCPLYNSKTQPKIKHVRSSQPKLPANSSHCLQQQSCNFLCVLFYLLGGPTPLLVDIVRFNPLRIAGIFMILKRVY